MTASRTTKEAIAAADSVIQDGRKYGFAKTDFIYAKVNYANETQVREWGYLLTLNWSGSRDLRPWAKFWLGNNPDEIAAKYAAIKAKYWPEEHYK